MLTAYTVMQLQISGQIKVSTDLRGVLQCTYFLYIFMKNVGN
jgi:hypothetical protein